MILAVVGSRKWLMPSVVAKVLDECRTNEGMEEIVTGGAAGVDSFAEAWAKLHLVPCTVLRPDWSIGRRGAAIRNAEIVKRCDRLVAFWDGSSRGTKMTISMAMKAGKLWRVYRE